MKMKKILITMMTVVALGAFVVNAQISEKITLHGFGAWSYGNTDGNNYLTGDDDGDYDHSQFFLNINANPFEKLTIIAQIGAVQAHDGIEFEFDYAFAEWAFTDAFKFRVGKVKHPFGIYGEVLNVGTIRPFFSLPQSIYGKQGFVGTGVNGVSLTGNLMSKSGWGLTYDVYAGQLRTIAEVPEMLSVIASINPVGLTDTTITLKKNITGLFGGRLSITTPIEGLSFGASGYFGEDKSGQAGFAGDQKSYGCFVEYMTASIWLRGEYVENIQSYDTGTGDKMETNIDTYYLEAAYKFLNHWQVAARYDYFKSDLTTMGMTVIPRFLEEYVKHKDVSLGINYWFNTNFVIKLSYHMVEGIKFAWPHFDDPIPFLMGNFNNKTKLVQFGVHFSF